MEKSSDSLWTVQNIQNSCDSQDETDCTLIQPKLNHSHNNINPLKPSGVYKYHLL
jgi:hypothetical protein